MINILIRTSNRPREFKGCINSIRNQTYKDVRLIVCTDKAIESTKYITEHTQGLNVTFFSIVPSGVPFHWNFYCNNLKERVTDGWFFYMDDDDFLTDRFCLAAIAPHLDERHGTICQFKRPKGSPKPQLKPGNVNPSDIIRGKIGGSCIFLHHTHKNLADWDGAKAADYRFIRDVAEKLPLVFVPISVVRAGNNGRKGK